MKKLNDIQPVSFAVLALLFAVLLNASCSSTSTVPSDDKLYIGLKTTRYENVEKNAHFYSVQEELEEALATAPNNALFGSSYYRWPWPPFRLWIGNAFADADGGVGRWIGRTFGSKPVLLSAVNPRLHTQVARELLRSRGYFSGYVDYDIIGKPESKKAKVAYRVNFGELHTVDTLEYRNFPEAAWQLIDSTRAEARVKPGDPFDVSALEAERSRVSTLLRNNGFFYYQPAYASYLADTLAVAGKAQVRLQYADSLPSRVARQWYVGRVRLELRKNALETLRDSTVRRRYTILYNGRRSPIRRSAVTRDMSLQPGKLYSYDDYLRSVNTLTGKGLFSRVDLSFAPHDTTPDCDTLDMTLGCVFDKPYNVSLEASLVGKTTGRIGPGVTLGFSKNNAFRGGEKLSLNLNGSYEWQTGHRADGTSSKFNSYEYGADISVEFPRLLFVNRFFNRIRRMRRKRGEPVKPYYTMPSTLVKASSDVLNRSGFFKRHVVSGELTYTVQPSAQWKHTFSPLILQYEYMQHQTEAFAEILKQSPYLTVSMADQFVPKMRYAVNYQSPAAFRNPIYWQLAVSEAANILSLGYMVFGNKWGEKGKTMFKNPYAQFFKVETDLRKTWQTGEHDQLVGHVSAGVVWSYGNAVSSPYSEQFYVGGANSIRAFNVRSIGPGKYYTDQTRLSYMDQTGDIKLQFNLEYRPRLMGNLYGAVFLDAGNVWAMRDDGYRAGSKFRVDNFFKEMALGTGVGIRYDMDFFVLRLDWGVGLHVPYKSGFYNMNSFKDSQSLHFAIGYPF